MPEGTDTDMASDTAIQRFISTGWTLAALGVSVLGTAGSLWLSIGMGLKACPLCLYQRTFLMGVAAVLVTGMFTNARRLPLLAVLALPAAFGGFGVAVFHVYLELTDKLECPPGIFGLGTAPQQSLTVFVVLFAALVTAVIRGRKAGEFGLLAIIAAGVLGVFLAVATVKSAPPLPAAPAKPYSQPLEMCRPPYHSPTSSP